MGKEAGDDTAGNLIGSMTTDHVAPSGSAAKTTKKEDTAATTTEPADPITTVLTNPDTLSRSLLFLDVSDVPSAARTCKFWNRTLTDSETENTLWLGLIRKHHPMAERIANMLPDDVGDAAANVRPAEDGIPPPSKRWKMQFKRQVFLESLPRADPPPTCKPLSSYFFEIRFLTRKTSGPRQQYNANLFGQEDMEEVGRVHTVVESAKFCRRDDEDVADYSEEDLVATKFLRLTFAYPPGRFDREHQFYSLAYEVTVNIYDRATGRTCELYKGHSDVYKVASLRRSTHGHDISCYSHVEVLSQEDGKIILDISFYYDDDGYLNGGQMLDIFQNRLPWK